MLKALNAALSDIHSRKIGDVPAHLLDSQSMVLPDKRPLVEMRATLLHGITPLTETWTYAVKL